MRAENEAQISWALDVINNWRAAHHYPLNGMCVPLKTRARKVDSNALISQRIKRLESIYNKLESKPTMELTQMQDIGGCRAVLRTVGQVYRLREVYKTKPLSHTFKNEKDYIANPKADGYRGVHLIYYFGGKEATAKSYSEKRMQIEIQIRTTLQHWWATALESAQVFTKQALKSNRGSTEWQRFFALVSSCFAHEEGYPLVPGTPTKISDVKRELKGLVAAHSIIPTFEAYRATLEHTSRRKDAKFFLITLDPISQQVTLKGFKASELKQANDEYTALEKNRSSTSASQFVLVSTDSVAQLVKAYPSYFLDTSEFITRVKRLVA